MLAFDLSLPRLESTNQRARFGVQLQSCTDMWMYKVGPVKINYMIVLPSLALVSCLKYDSRSWRSREPNLGSRRLLRSHNVNAELARRRADCIIRESYDSLVIIQFFVFAVDRYSYSGRFGYE